MCQIISWAAKPYTMEVPTSFGLPITNSITPTCKNNHNFEYAYDIH